MSTNTALAISIGVLGAVATWLFLGPLGGMLAIWAAFIAWGCFFHCGGKETGLQSAVLGNIAGAVVAGITLWVATQSGIGDALGLPIWAGICVGIGVAAMVFLANVPVFAAIPAQVYGFASVVALTLLGNAAGNLTALSMENPGGGHCPLDDCRRDLRLGLGESRWDAGTRVRREGQGLAENAATHALGSPRPEALCSRIRRGLGFGATPLILPKHRWKPCFRVCLARGTAGRDVAAVTNDLNADRSAPLFGDGAGCQS